MAKHRFEVVQTFAPAGVHHHHRHPAQSLPQGHRVDFHPLPPGHVGHIEHQHHGQGQVDELGGEQQSALQVGHIHHRYHRVGRTAQQMIQHHLLVG